jgi:hypothetical protein
MKFILQGERTIIYGFPSGLSSGFRLQLAVRI